jgi:RNA polymerase sigma factor
LTQEEKEILVKENRWVVNDVINKYTHLMERDELEAAGLLGLIEGIEKFKTGHGTKISTYVRHWIKARVLGVVYENRIVHVPWNKINSYIKAQKNSLDSAGVSGHQLSVNYTPKFEISLDRSNPSSTWEEGDPLSSDSMELQSSLSSEDISKMEERHTAEHIEFAIGKSELSVLEKRAITLRFGLSRRSDPMTFSQVGTLTGLSTMGAQKAVIRGLKKLQNNSYIRELVE